MAEMTLKRRGEFQRAILEILSKADQPVQASEALRQLEKVLPPTPYEAGYYPKHPDVRRYEKIARFNSIGPVKAGWIIKNKGLWSITAEGKKALATYKDPIEIAKKEHELYLLWQSTQPDQDGGAESESVQAIIDLEEAEESAWVTIQDYLGKINPFEFQKLVAVLIRAMGYHIDWIAPPGPDEGIDIIALTDPLGIEGPRMKVQVKRRADKVDGDELASFLARLGDNDRGVYVSLGGFTSEAEKNSRRQEKRQVTLIDAEKLFDLWVEHYPKIDENGKNLLPLKAIHYLATRPA